MLRYICTLILVVSCCKTVLSKDTKQGMRNKHLLIEGEFWKPFLMYEIDANWTAIEGTYHGVMWDLLMFMQQARNFTFTMVSEADFEWGACHVLFAFTSPGIFKQVRHLLIIAEIVCVHLILEL